MLVSDYSYNSKGRECGLAFSAYRERGSDGLNGVTDAETGGEHSGDYLRSQRREYAGLNAASHAVGKHDYRRVTFLNGVNMVAAKLLTVVVKAQVAYIAAKIIILHHHSNSVTPSALSERSLSRR